MLFRSFLGGAAVSIYYVATLLGKLLATVVSPINSVVLSYLARLNGKPKELFWLTLLVCLIVCVIGYVITIAISEPILAFLYPQFVDESIVFIYITTAAAYMNVVASVMNPVVLKFTPMRTQILVNGGYLVLYVTVALAMLAFNGLYGFCVGTLVASAGRCVALVVAFEATGNAEIETL